MGTSDLLLLGPLLRGRWCACMGISSKHGDAPFSAKWGLSARTTATSTFKAQPCTVCCGGVLLMASKRRQARVLKVGLARRQGAPVIAGWAVNTLHIHQCQSNYCGQLLHPSAHASASALLDALGRSLGGLASAVTSISGSICQASFSTEYRPPLRCGGCRQARPGALPAVSCRRRALRPQRPTRSRRPPSVASR